MTATLRVPREAVKNGYNSRMSIQSSVVVMAAMGRPKYGLD